MIRRGLFILLAMIVLVLLLASKAEGQDGGLPTPRWKESCRCSGA